MKYLNTWKLFNENTFHQNGITTDYLNDEDAFVDKVNEIINNPKFNKIVHGIPDYLKRKINKFLSSGETLDMDKMISLNKRYNIFEKVKRLWESGVTKIEDIYKNMINDIPKNESVIVWTIIMLIFLIIGGFALFALFSGGAEWGIIFPAIFCFLISYGAYTEIVVNSSANRIVKELSKENIKVNTLEIKLNNKTKRYIILEDEYGKKDTLTMKQFFELDNKEFSRFN